MGDAARSFFSASIALLAGYAFIRLSYYRRFRAEHLRTDRFALHVLGLSFVFFLGGSLAAELIPHWTFERFLHLEESLEKVGITAAVIDAILLGSFAGVIDNLLIRFQMRKDGAMLERAGFIGGMRTAALSLFIRKTNDSAIRAIFRATILKKDVMVTLKSNKVYIGKPYRVLWDDPTQALTFIKILPLKSGYRDPDTKKVTITTRYDALRDQLVELDLSNAVRDPANPLASEIWGLGNERDEVIAEIDIEDLGVVISWTQVESLTIYDDNLYKAFQALPPTPPVALVTAD